MNKHLFRVIFNRSVGLLQVVAEIARRHGRHGPKSESGAKHRSGPCWSTLGTQITPICLGLWFTMGQVALVHADIRADAQAPSRQQPTILTAPNGTPLVNIQTPSAAGVSRNSYHQFDVDQQGAILNNARETTQTQLGGWVEANPWLSQGTARVILNEVNSADPSLLKGYVEVAGDRAQVVIANPAGISCEGCGFINANRLTLTTGTPILNQGALAGYRVEGGLIRVDGQGLDASTTDFTDIIARSVEVNAGLWAQSLQVTTGLNEVDASTHEVGSSNDQPAADHADTESPRYALDVSALGGMYANKIVLVGTEHGLGVRNAGNLGAQAGDFTLTADGRLDNTGAIQAAADTRIEVASGVVNHGTISAGHALSIEATQALDNTQGTLNAPQLDLHAASLDNTAGQIEQASTELLAISAGQVSNRDQGVMGATSAEAAEDEGASSSSTNGSATTPDAVSSETVATEGADPGSRDLAESDRAQDSSEDGTKDSTKDRAEVDGQDPTHDNVPAYAPGAIQVTGLLNNDQGHIQGAGALDLAVANGLDNEGGQIGVRRLTVQGERLNNHQGHLMVGQSAELTALNLDNDQGLMQLTGDLSLQASQVSNREGSLIHQGTQTSQWHISEQLNNYRGQLASSASGWTLNTPLLVNTKGQLIHAGTGLLTLQADQLSSAQGQISSAGQALINTVDADLSGASVAVDQLTLQGKSLDNRGGEITATGVNQNTIHVDRLDNQTHGRIETNGDLAIQTQEFLNAGGAVRHAGSGTLSIQAETLAGQGGTLASNGALELTGQTTDLSQGVTQGHSLAVTTSTLNNQAGQLLATGSAPLSLTVSGQLNNAQGRIGSNGQVLMASQQLDNRKGAITAAGGQTSKISVQGTLNNQQGQLITAGAAELSAAQLLNAKGQITSQSALSVQAHQQLDNHEGLLSAGQGLSVRTAMLDNRQGRVQQSAQAASLSLQVDHLNGAGGQLLSNGALTISGQTTQLTGAQTQGRSISIKTGTLETAHGRMLALGEDTLALNVSGMFDNTQGEILGNGGLMIRARNMRNTEGKIAAAGSTASFVAIEDTLDNQQGQLTTAGQTDILASALNNQQGLIAVSQAPLAVQISGTLDNSQQGRIASDGDLTLSSQTLDNQQGEILHAGDGTALIMAQEDFLGAGGTIASNGVLDMRIGRNTELAGAQTEANLIRIETDVLDNTEGAIHGRGALDFHLRKLINRKGQLSGAGTSASQVEATELFDNTEGSLVTAGDLDVNAGTLSNQGGRILAADTSGLQINVAQTLDNSAGGLLAAGGDMSVVAETLNNQSGSIQHAGSGELSIEAHTLAGQSGSIVSNGALTLTGETTQLNQADTQAKAIQIHTGTLNNAAGTLVASSESLMAIETRQQLDNTQGTLATNGALMLQAGTLLNQNGTVSVAGHDASTLEVSGRLDNQQGQIVSAGDTALYAGALNNEAGLIATSHGADSNSNGAHLKLTVEGTLSNQHEGLITADGDLSIDAALLDNQQGQIHHVGEGQALIHATDLQGQEGEIASNGQLTLTGDHTDLSHALIQARDLSIQTDHLNNSEGHIAVQGGFDFDLQSLNNHAGQLLASGDQDNRIHVAQTLDNTEGTIATAGDTQVRVGQLLNQQGVLLADDARMHVTATDSIQNQQGGMISAVGELQVDAAQLNNQQGTLQQLEAGHFVLNAQNLEGQKGLIASQGTLTLTGQQTDLTAATTQAEQIQIKTDALVHKGATLLATGEQLLSLDVSGQLDNQGGKIATNGALKLQAASLDNQQGRLSAAGAEASTVDVEHHWNNQQGHWATVGRTTIHTETLNNQQGQLATGDQADLSITATQRLDNQQQGMITAGGDLSVAAQELNNQSGAIEHAGSGQLTVDADTFKGHQGQMLSNGQLVFTGHDTDLSGGATQAKQIQLTTDHLNNAQGVLAASSDQMMQLTVAGTLDNQAGHIAGNGALLVSAGELINQNGQFTAAGQGASTLEIQGVLDNQKGQLLTAGSLNAQAQKLDNRQGTIATTEGGLLTLTVDQQLNNQNNGLISADGDLNLSSRTLNNQQGQIHHVGTGDALIQVDTLNGKSGAIVSNGALSLLGQHLDLRQATTSAQGITLEAQTLQHMGATLAATGSGQLKLTAHQRLDNTQGTIATNGELAIKSADLINQEGTLQGAGHGHHSIIGTNTFNNRQGQVTTAGETVIQAGQLDNQSGHLHNASSAALTVNASDQLNNSGGVIGGKGRVGVQAGTINNTGGHFQSDGQLQIQANNMMVNRNGHLASRYNMRIRAAELDNRDSKLISRGNLDIKVEGKAYNYNGLLQAGHKLILESDELFNANGVILADDVDIDTRRHRLNNRGGTIASTEGDVSIESGSINNIGGLIQSKGSMEIETGQYHSIDNRRSDGKSARKLKDDDVAGLISGQDMTIKTYRLNNQDGFIYGEGPVALDVHEVTNTDGLIGGATEVSLEADTLDNQGGRLQSIENLTMTLADKAQNDGGLMVAGQTLTLEAAEILNGNTQGDEQGIQGREILLTTPMLDNTSGLIVADERLNIESEEFGGVLNNQQGEISSLKDIDIHVSEIKNKDGTLLAGSGGRLTLETDQLTGNGRLLSQGGMDVTINGDWVNGGEIAADGFAQFDIKGNFNNALEGKINVAWFYLNSNTLFNVGDIFVERKATLNVSDQVANSGVIHAGEFNVHTHTVTNTAKGEIDGDKGSIVANGGFSNRGLIDGGDLRLEGKVLFDNLAGGRIYGDHLAIQTHHLRNYDDQGQTPVIAARDRLDIGAGVVHNREHAEIISMGTGANALNIGGGLDEHNHAIGQGAQILNESATIESAGGMSLASANIINKNMHFALTDLQKVGDDETVHYVQEEGNPTRSNLEEDFEMVPKVISVFGGVDNKSAGYQYRNKTTGAYLKKWAQYVYTQKTYETQVASSDPAMIRSGGDMTLTGGAITNDKSKIIAGGRLLGNVDSIENIQAIGTRKIQQAGKRVERWAKNIPWFIEPPEGSEYEIYAGFYPIVENGNSTDVKEPDLVEEFELEEAVIEEHARAGGVGSIATRNGATVDRSVDGTSGVSAEVADGAIGEVTEASYPNQSNSTGNGSGSGGQDTSISAPGRAQGQQAASTQGPDAAQSASATAASGPARAQGQSVEQVVVDTPQGGGSGTSLTASASPDQVGGHQVAQQSAPEADAQTAVSSTKGVQRAVGQAGADYSGPEGVHAQQVTHAQATLGTVRTTQVNTQAPRSSLFNQAPDSAGYLVETDPRFADYRTWLGSDYLLSKADYKPELTQKRLGDGFYEQRLVRDQITQLTGRPFLNGYANEEVQYQHLLDAGYTVAQQWQLRPGVALNAEQMAQLTSDVVLMVEKTVTQADGSQTQALVPQVYVQAKQGDLNGNGSLISAGQIDLAASGDIRNTGTIAGRDLVKLSGDNLRNLGGRIQANALDLAARNDLDNIGGTLQAEQYLKASAGHDLNITSTTYDAGTATIGMNESSRTTIQRVAGLYVNGVNGQLFASAQHDVNLTAAEISNQGAQGTTILSADHDLNLKTVNTSQRNDIYYNAKNYVKNSVDTEVGTSVDVAGNLGLSAGHDLNTRAATISSDHGLIEMVAGQDINLEAGEQHNQYAMQYYKKRKHHFKTKVKIRRDRLDETLALASTVSGNLVKLEGANVNLAGSNVVSDQGTSITAHEDINVDSVTQTHATEHYRFSKTTGLFSGGGLSLTIGRQAMSFNQEDIHKDEAVSTVGSTHGDILLSAGHHYNQTGGNIQATEGNVNINAQQVNINEARESFDSEQKTKFSQSGLTVAITAPIIQAFNTITDMASASKQTDDKRMQALAAGSSALAAKNAYDATSANADNAGGIEISVTVGSSKSRSSVNSSSNAAVSSTITAGQDVKIVASGAGDESDLNLRGTQVNAGRNIDLAADHDINLTAAQNESNMKRKNSSVSGALGIALAYENGEMAFGIKVDASGSKGKGKGHDITLTNTHINANDTLTLTSGQDTNLQGAVASGDQVVANIGGDLNIESLQDISSFKSQDMSAGFSGVFGYGATVSASLGYQKIDGDFASVTEQSGIEAGDGGFQINVNGNTDLNGGAIKSSHQAADEGLNQLTTGTLTTRDIDNHSKYSATSVSASGSMKMGGGGMMPIGGGGGGGGAGGGMTGGGMPVALHDSQRDTSSTRSGISDGQITITDQAGQAALTPGKSIEDIIAGLNREVETGRDTSGSLSNNLDEDEINAKFAIASTFVKETATYIKNRGKEVDRAKKALDTEKEKTADERDDALVAQLEQQYKTALIENETWLPGGTGRKVVNALNAAVGGNLSAGATQFVQMGVANYLQQEGATLLGRWTHEGKLTEGSPLHAALHGAVGCLGAAAGGGDCGAGGMGAATSSLLTNLFTAQPDETFAEKETKRDIIVGLTTAMALGTNLDPGNAMNSAVSSVDNNYLTNSQMLQLVRELNECSLLYCVALLKWKVISDIQDGALAAGMAAGIPASLADSIKDFVGLFNLDTWEGMYDLFHRDDVLKVLGKSVVDEYTARLERWEENYQKGGIEGAYAAGVEQGKLLTELASLLAPGGALAKIGAKVASITGKAALETIGRVAGRGAHTADHVEDAAKTGDNLADLERKTDLPEHRDSTAGRETGQDSHTHDDVATSTNEPRTNDNASSVGQNEASNHSGVDGSVANTVFTSLDELNALKGSGNRVGDLSSVKGAKVQDIVANIPESASVRKLQPVEGKSQMGLEYKWVDENGITNRLRIHDSDPSHPGSNAANGWIARWQQKGGYYNPATNSFAHKNAHKPESPHYDPFAANNTHIPIETPETWLMDLMKINSNGD